MFIFVFFRNRVADMRAGVGLRVQDQLRVQKVWALQSSKPWRTEGAC